MLYLLGIVEPGSALPTMDPAIRRQRTFEAIARLLVRESQNQTLILLIEDLQWLDSETEAFLNVLIEDVPGARMLLLVNYRSEYRHDWSHRPYYTHLCLEPLDQAEALQRSAQLEAIGHLSAALDLLKSLPDTPERLREDLTLLLTLGPAWMAARGFGASEVEATYTRALALSEQGGETPQSFSAQLGLWSFYLLRFPNSRQR
ncbi:hypothetical protein N234_37480 [Ralstonia pickettii DTP0602]|nr:hypothetical protein N234_37480 [Ralstonia pickettii DTP0602]